MGQELEQVLKQKLEKELEQELEQELAKELEQELEQELKQDLEHELEQELKQDLEHELGVGVGILLTRPSKKTSSLYHTTLAITINPRVGPRVRADHQLEPQ